MLKSMKKAASLLLAVVMIFSMNFAAFAETVDTETAAPETIAEEIAETILDELETENETASVQASANSGRITADPADVSVYAYEDAVFSVETSGNVAKYQWQISQTNGLFWTNLSARSYGASETITVNARKAYNNALFRCIVTFKDRKTAVSGAAKLTVLASGIAADPSDVTVTAGSEAVFTVGTNGPVNYVQWQALKAGAKKWANLDQTVYGNAETLSLTAETEDDGLQVRAYVVFKDGTKVTSKAAALTVNEAVEAVSETVELENVSVAVDYSSDVFDEEVELSAEVFDEDSKGYKEAEDVMAANNVSYDGMMAVDISFLSKANGSEVEPNGDVNVNLQADLEALGEDVDPESIRVWHITEEGLELVSGNVYEAPAEEPEPEIEEPVEVSAAFTVNSFSTFTVTWGNNEGSSVTVHHGYMDGGRFVEFTAAQSLNPNNYPSTRLRARDYSSGQYAYLIYDFKDYKYSATYRTNAATANPTGGTSVRPTLLAYGNQGNSRIWYTHTGDNSGYDDLSNGNHVYVIYTKKAATTGYTPPTDEDPDTPHPESYVPEVGKVVTDMKPDGTYDITLSVVGHEESSEQVVKARVIVVFDISGSMAWGMGGQGSGGSSRLSLAKTAVNKLADTLLTKVDSHGNKLVEAGLVTFSSDATKRQFSNQDFTSDATTYKNVINGLNANGGTNWEAALDLANSMAASTNGKTYIVFVSDGNPTFRTSRDDLSDAGVRGDQYDYNNGNIRFGTGQTGSATETPCFNTAKIAAQSIIDHNKTLYTVGLSNDASKMETLNKDAIYYDGSDADTFAAALESIASAIESSLGLSEVEITDGVTEMSQVATDALIGTTGNFIYRKGTNADISQNPIWNGAPEAELDANNSVIWDLSEAGKLDNGVTYSVTFTVWPKQEAYDLIADLDNSLRKVTDSDLAAGTKAQLRVLVGGTTYEYDTASGTWTGGLTDAQLQAKIDAGDPVFSMKTNTGLSASYEYGGVPGSHNYTDYINGNMALDDTPIKIKKTWNNYMDAREASDVTLTITRDGHDYMTIVMGEPTEVTTTDGGKQWIQTPTQELYISLGVLSVTDGNIIVRETGYDYTVVEPENFSYRWDLTADIYHPMVINGKTTVLIEVQDTTGLPSSVTGLAENKSVTVGDLTYYKFNNNLYVTKPGENLLEATNDRRSNLIINKVVDAEDAPEDDLFLFEITIDNPNAPHPGDEGYNDWYHTSWFYISTAENDRDTIILEDIEVSDNVTPEVSELRTDNTDITNIVTHAADDDYPYDYITYNYKGEPNTVKAVDLELHTGSETVDGETVTYQYYAYYTGFYWFDNGATATVKIKDGWYINFNNMGRDTAYEIVEPTADLPDGYTFKEATTAAVNTQNLPVTPGTVDENTVTGTIDRPNSDYKATYKNTFDGFFYVYHSSNNKVERHPIAVDGVKITTFNIYERTAEGTLYGGYYSDYEGKSTGFDYTVAAGLDYSGSDYPVDPGDDFNAYSYQYIKDSGKAAWNYDNAGSVDGKAMTVEKDGVYYLKEVPTGYLQPYTHYTYYKEGFKVANVWTISGLDDLNYSGAGFVVQTDDKTATVTETLSIRAANSTATTTLNAGKVYKAKGVLDGYLGYAEITSYKPNTITIVQYWTTKDGIKVYGTMQRKLEFGDGTITGIKKTDTAYTPAP